MSWGQKERETNLGDWTSFRIPSAKISLEILSQKDHTLGVGNREAALGELGWEVGCCAGRATAQFQTELALSSIMWCDGTTCPGQGRWLRCAWQYVPSLFISSLHPLLVSKSLESLPPSLCFSPPWKELKTPFGVLEKLKDEFKTIQGVVECFTHPHAPLSSPVHTDVAPFFQRTRIHL